MIGVKTRNLGKFYDVDGRRVSALKDFDVDIASGSTVCVVGYSGCGKTTLLRLIAGIETPDEGRVGYMDSGGRDCECGRVGMVFQEPRLLPWLTVEKNISLALRHTDTDRDQADVIDEVLDLIGIQDFRHAYPDQLSGGMAQRVALGRALCRKPDLMLMDEPFGALDALTRRKLQNELAGIFIDPAVTTVLVTHDVSEAVLLGDKVIVMEQGGNSREVVVPYDYPRDRSSPGFIRLRDEVLDAIFK